MTAAFQNGEAGPRSTQDQTFGYPAGLLHRRGREYLANSTQLESFLSGKLE
jgi:hypothetical protein